MTKQFLLFKHRGLNLYWSPQPMQQLSLGRSQRTLALITLFLNVSVSQRSLIRLVVSMFGRKHLRTFLSQPVGDIRAMMTGLGIAPITDNPEYQDYLALIKTETQS